MTGPEPAVPASERARILTGLARRAIESELGELRAPAGAAPTLPEWLRKPAATFVTLALGDRLRGCIGSLKAQRSLSDDVEANARAAAFEDPRFPPLTEPELEGLAIEVSVLSEPEPLACRSEAELLAALRPGVDGLVLEHETHRATFLPQVWSNLREPEQFLAALKRKARLPADYWSDEMRFSRYTVESFGEPA